MKDVGYLNSLPQEEFIARRNLLISKLPINSLTLIFGAQEKTRNSDCDFKFRQDSYFWYLTGFNEPNSILAIYKKDADHATTSIFLRKKDPVMETWTGVRLGKEAAPQTLQVDFAYDVDSFKEDIFKFLHEQEVTEFFWDKEIQPWAQEYLTVFPTATALVNSYRPLVDEMRLFKSENEVRLMQRAGEISAFGHIRAMKHCFPNKYEYELEHEIIYEFARHGALFCSYNSIVASGNHANTLHYEENTSLMQDGDLVLIDAGCEYDYYAGDITRTFPVNGKFTEAQKEVYNLVLKAQLTGISLLIPGNTLQQASDAVVEVLVDGLLELGIMQGTKEEIIKNQTYRKFYMHSLGHWLGLDVHDVGAYRSDKSRVLEPGIAVTVEPGLYLNANFTDIPEKYRGIGIRIEDDIVITEYGNKVLTDAVPKEVADIEALMQNRIQ